MLVVYPAVMHEEDGSFWLEFPDLEGCQTFGDTLEETLASAEEALGLYLAVLMENGEEIPQSSDINKIDADEGTATYVYTDVNKYHRDTRAVKKMISIPAWLAKEAESRHYSLSRILQDALLTKMNGA